jgi:hypothetical protein
MVARDGIERHYSTLTIALVDIQLLPGRNARTFPDFPRLPSRTEGVNIHVRRQVPGRMINARNPSPPESRIKLCLFATASTPEVMQTEYQREFVRLGMVSTLAEKP